MWTGDPRGATRLGSLVVGLRPHAECLFRWDSARSVHAALLRRIERVDASLSRALHEAERRAHQVVRPWTISNLWGPFERHRVGWVAVPPRLYWVRVTALTTSVLAAVQHVVSESATVELERAPFELTDVHSVRTTTYRELAAASVANGRVDMCWFSPTRIQSRQRPSGELPPDLCLASYLRRWNVFADVDLRLPEAPLLEYAREGISVVDANLLSAISRPGRFRVKGSVGHSTWVCEQQTAELIRQVNLLVGYAFYAGTGVKTALGMGQTVSRPPTGLGTDNSVEQMLRDRFE